ncbi:MAG: hypothetical protein LBF38_03860 [Deltaproteobacteria bacterium]|jgi:hypothetical protein|nr:hypothetical protein [Deltaproteobacteria bacterium]
MQIDSGNNYNTLGKMGPIYPRPEYRPKNSTKDNPEETQGGAKDKVNVSGGKGEKGKAAKDQKAQAQTQPALSDGRLNLQSAKILTQATAEAIANLPPEGRNQAPHTVKGLGLLPPRYV